MTIPRTFLLFSTTSNQDLNTGKKNLVNIHPSLSHAWSITQTVDTTGRSGSMQIGISVRHSAV